MYETNNRDHQDKVSACVHKMMQRALAMEGTVSVSPSAVRQRVSVLNQDGRVNTR